MKQAEIAFKELGSRTPLEAEATLTLSLRRHWGLTFVREYARMRSATRAGQEIQRSGLTQRFCDQYGQQLCLATLPGDSFRARHDAIATVVIGDVLRAGIPGCREPKTLFTHILPQPVLERKAHCGIIPDARLRVPELAPPLASGPRPSRYCNPDYLFDVKTISAAGPCYRSAAVASMALEWAPSGRASDASRRRV